MCDYSLDLVASRPAKVGDALVTTKFQNSMTRGFALLPLRCVIRSSDNRAADDRACLAVRPTA
jgi:hypothetical protein